MLSLTSIGCFGVNGTFELASIQKQIYEMEILGAIAPELLIYQKLSQSCSQLNNKSAIAFVNQ